MHVECRLALNQLWDHGGQHGQESEEGKEEVSEEEKEVTSQRKPRSIRISSDVRCALRSLDRVSFRQQNIRRKNGLAGPLCRWLLHNGSAFFQISASAATAACT